MNHLKTSEERQERWYSKLTPRYVSIRKPSCAQDVLLSLSKEKDETVHVFEGPSSIAF